MGVSVCIWEDEKSRYTMCVNSFQWKRQKKKKKETQTSRKLEWIS